MEVPAATNFVHCVSHHVTQMAKLAQKMDQRNLFNAAKPSMLPPVALRAARVAECRS